MRTTDTVIIGGGQAGLAMSRCLTDRGVDHVVLERGRVGERWRSERWDSLRLLTPSWQSRLPGWSYLGPDPDGFMTKDEVVAFLDGYALSSGTPLETGTHVTSLEQEGSGYRLATDRGGWRARSVVIATGHCDRPIVPEFAGRISPGVVQATPRGYRRPSDLPPGGVLIVGASATGVQLAEEIHRSGRPVTLAVGGHTRLPRRYRGRDIQWWLDVVGVWGTSIEDVRDAGRSRREPSLQLIGSPDHRTLDLGILQDEGVRLVGRAVGAQGTRIGFAVGLTDDLDAADARLARLLRRIDGYVELNGLSAAVPPPERPRPIRAPIAPASLDLRGEGIATVFWAAGFRRAYPWLRVPVLDAGGEIRHDGGLTPAPGLYVLGLQFLRTRKSSLIDGVGADAEFLADHVAARRRARCTAA